MNILKSDDKQSRTVGDRRHNDRRTGGDRRRNSDTRTAIIHITRSQLRVLVVVHRAGGQQPLAICRNVPWRIDADSLYSSQGAAELAAAVAKVAGEERLAGSQAEVLLGSELCVTRAVSGAVDEVQREINVLRERSQLYLSLGPGRKVSATSTTPLDARHSHAMLTVATEQSLRAVSEALESAGIELLAIRSAQVAVAHTVQRAEGDNSTAALSIGVDGGTIEFGIMKAGRLFLDYLPGGDASVENVTQLVAQHHTRLQRYCQRHHGLAGDDLTRVVVSGEAEVAHRVLSDMRRIARLDVSLVDPAEVQLPWDLRGESLTPEMAAAVGCGLALEEESGGQGPNLMDQLVSTTRPAILPMLIRKLAPMAAAMLAAVVFIGLNWMAGREVAKMRAQVAELAPRAARSTTVRMECLAMDNKSQQLDKLASRIVAQPYSLLLNNLTQSLPAEVWLSNVRFDGPTATIAGSSYVESSIYDMVGHLQHLPGVASVALQGTGIGRTAHRNATTFDIHFDLDFTGQAKQSEESL